MCKGDAHDAYGLGPFDHIEPAFGLYSNHPLSDPEIYDDDYLVHGSDYSPDGVKNLGYFRKFNSMVDTIKMDGNCKNAQAPHGLNQAYPCYNDQQNWGAAITGLKDPKKITLPLSLFVDNWKEPNVRTGEKPVAMTATILVKGLTAGKEYVVYMFETTEAYPSDSLFHEAGTPSSSIHSKLKRIPSSSLLLTRSCQMRWLTMFASQQKNEDVIFNSQ